MSAGEPSLFVGKRIISFRSAISTAWQTGGRSPEIALRSLSGSFPAVTALAAVQEPGMILGMGRAISDRASDAYIQDIMVRPEVRRQAIASCIMKVIVERLERDGMTWIGLIAKQGTQSFYRGVGFSEMPDATPMLRKMKSFESDRRY